MEISRQLGDFFRKYSNPLLRLLLKDSDLNMSILYDNEKILFYKTNNEKSRENEVPNPRKLSKIELIEFVETLQANQFLSRRFLPTHIIIEKEDIDFLLDENYDLSYIQMAEGIKWTENLIDSYKNYWDWKGLSKNSKIKWTENLIDRYKEKVDFHQLSYNTNLEMTTDLFLKYIDKWDMNGVSGNPSIVLQIEDTILSHPSTIWISKPDNDYETCSVNTFLLFLNDTYNYHNNEYWGIKPCISTNPGLDWTLKKFNMYKNKIDFWLLAMFGKIDEEIITKHGVELDESRKVRTVYSSWSDWPISYPVYKTGWENLMDNFNFYVNRDLLLYLRRVKFSKIEFEGNMMDTPVNKEVNVFDIIPADKIKIEFEQLYSYSHLIPEKYLNEISIDDYIYKNIIKPELLKNREYVRYILKCV